MNTYLPAPSGKSGHWEGREAVWEGSIKRQKIPALSGVLFVSVIKEEQSILHEESVKHCVPLPPSSPTALVENTTLFAKSTFKGI